MEALGLDGPGPSSNLKLPGIHLRIRNFKVDQQIVQTVES